MPVPAVGTIRMVRPSRCLQSSVIHADRDAPAVAEAVRGRGVSRWTSAPEQSYDLVVIIDEGGSRISVGREDDRCARIGSDRVGPNRDRLLVEQFGEEGVDLGQRWLQAGSPDLVGGRLRSPGQCRRSGGSCIPVFAPDK